MYRDLLRKTEIYFFILMIFLPVSASFGQSATGFTLVKPSADSKLIYVSNSQGNNTNNCLSQAAPCKTIGAGLEKMRTGYPDHLYLKSGDVWRDQRLINLPSGRSANEPAVISFYGTSGARPKIENSTTTLNIYKGRTVNFHIIGLEFSAYQLDPLNPGFTATAKANISLLGANENILFEDNKFSFTEVAVQEWQGQVPRNIAFRRNIWTGAYYNKSSFDKSIRPSNLYAAGVDGLTMVENVFDNGGWHPTILGSGANMFNHNIYVQYSTSGAKLSLVNNIITRASSHGAQLRSGGLAQNNFFARNAVGLLMGYNAVEAPVFKGVRVHALDNVVSEGYSMIKGDKPCSATNLCTSALWGIDFSVNGEADYQLHGNITSLLSPDDKLWGTKYKSLTKKAFRGIENPAVSASNNIAWKWESTTQGTTQKYPAPDRTLADYNASLGGTKSFDAFMKVVLNRPLQVWDERYTAAAINKYIRAGFGK